MLRVGRLRPCQDPRTSTLRHVPMFPRRRRPVTAVFRMPAAVARPTLGVAEFVVVTVWPVAARQQRRVAILESQVPVPNHPNDDNACCLRQMSAG